MRISSLRGYTHLRQHSLTGYYGVAVSSPLYTGFIMYVTANQSCIILVDRLKEYITLVDVCNYIGIKPYNLSKMTGVDVSNEYLPEDQRTELYHLQKIKYYVKNGVEDPIDIDCISLRGQQRAWPVILDGRHRYAAALLRRDKTIPAVYSGDKKLGEYLCGN